MRTGNDPVKTGNESMQGERPEVGAAARRRGRDSPLPLPDNATVVVVGGGPAGSFFAIRLLHKARQAGRTVNVVILEKKTEICFYSPVSFSSWEGCNYCAGGVSPRLVDALRAENVLVPDEVIESRPPRSSCTAIGRASNCRCRRAVRCSRFFAGRDPASGRDDTSTSTPSSLIWPLKKAPG